MNLSYLYEFLSLRIFIIMNLILSLTGTFIAILCVHVSGGLNMPQPVWGGQRTTSRFGFSPVGAEIELEFSGLVASTLTTLAHSTGPCI